MMVKLDFFRCSSMLAFGILFFSLTMIGCGGTEDTKKRGYVTITVTNNGSPVTEGEVRMMISGKGEAAVGRLNESGQVDLEDVVLGNYSVAVAPPELATPDNPAPEKEYPNLPQKYRDISKSPLKAEVKAGSNEFTFDLKN